MRGDEKIHGIRIDNKEKVNKSIRKSQQGKKKKQKLN